MSLIPLSVPNLKGNELKYVTAAVQEEWVSTSGPFISEFENRISEYVHAKGAVACQNGTSGLHIALILSGVTKGDLVIVPTLTFIAAVNPVKYLGAEPVFMDCDDSLCIDPAKLEKFCQEECSFIGDQLVEKGTGKRIRAIVAVHIFGNMANMDSLMDIAGKYNLKVIEDATEALGTYYLTGKYKGRYAGTIGDIGVYSFNGNKIITTGGGGMIVTDNETYLKRGRHLTTQAKADKQNYIHDDIGYNYRMTNLQAALGLAQLEQLEAFIEIKIKNFNFYFNALKEIDGLTLLPIRNGVRGNHWFYALDCGGPYESKRDAVIEYLARNNVQARPIWGLIHEQIPYCQARKYRIEKATYYWKRIVNIPCSTNLTEQDAGHVIRLLKAFAYAGR